MGCPWSRAACWARSEMTRPLVTSSWPLSADFTDELRRSEMQPVRVERDLSRRPDDDLVALVRNGNGAAFAAIMQRYSPRLFRVARGVVRDDSEAEDVLQEAYVRAYAGLGGFRGEAALGTWLTRIVLNEAMGRLRRLRPTEELEAIDEAVLSGDSR